MSPGNRIQIGSSDSAKRGSHPMKIVTTVCTLILLTVTSWIRADQPNVVIFFTDDQGTLDGNCYGSSDLITPNIERLAKDGLVFNHAYSNAPVCSTARSTIISGCYVPRLGAQYHRAELPVAMPEGLRPFP